MKRRQFIAATALAGAAPLTACAAVQDSSGTDYFELRKYMMHVGPKRQLLNDFLRDVAIPALNRAGVAPVGVFTPMFGGDNNTLYVLMPHRSLASLAGITDRLLADSDYLRDGADFLDRPLNDAAYERMESSLMVAFQNIPHLEVPESTAAGRPRIFELRIYESHSVKAGKKKVEMFNDGGEIAIFRKTGLTPVFFGETIVGPLMPNLTYMLTFDDMSQREEAWGVFSADPDWIALRGMPEYADTVSRITDIILQPARYSQI